MFFLRCYVSTVACVRINVLSHSILRCYQVPLYRSMRPCCHTMTSRGSTAAAVWQKYFRLDEAPLTTQPLNRPFLCVLQHFSFYAKGQSDVHKVKRKYFLNVFIY